MPDFVVTELPFSYHYSYIPETFFNTNLPSSLLGTLKLKCNDFSQSWCCQDHLGSQKQIPNIMLQLLTALA
jgi:hypothetical protein